MFMLLFLVCACLVVLDQQRQRVLAGMRTEVDNMHARMNAAGLIDNIRGGQRARVEESTEFAFDPFAAFRLPRVDTNGGTSTLAQTLQAVSNDQLHHIAETETQ